MNTETDVGKLIAREVKARVQRIASLALLANVALALVLWVGVTAKAGADIREEVGKVSESYIRRESAALEGLASHAVGQTREEIDRLQAALMEKVLQSEQIAMALDGQKRELEQRRATLVRKPGGTRVALTE